jgi:hypothetical protein
MEQPITNMEQELTIPVFTGEYVESLNETDASLLYKTLREYEKKVEAHKEAKTKPLNATLKIIRDEYRVLEEQLATAIQMVRQHMLALESARPASLTEIAPVTVTKYRTVTRLKVVDEALVPREFLVVDEKSVTQALKSGIQVPGCEKTVSL